MRITTVQKFEVRRTLGTSYFIALQLGWLLYQAWVACNTLNCGSPLFLVIQGTLQTFTVRPKQVALVFMCSCCPDLLSMPGSAAPSQVTADLRQTSSLLLVMPHL
jgi:hypothetical protein